MRRPVFSADVDRSSQGLSGMGDDFMLTFTQTHLPVQVPSCAIHVKCDTVSSDTLVSRRFC